jgi:3-mercaptopyruvate sulfurtransferase SseA
MIRLLAILLITLSLGSAAESERFSAVLDVRADEDYMGWRLRGEPRGGHVPHAVHVPVEWLLAAGSPGKVRELLVKRGIEPSHHVTIAGWARDPRTADVAGTLRRAGYPHVSVLEGGMEKWLADASKPLEKLPGHRMLVPARWLMAAQAGQPVAEAPAGRLTILEASWGPGDKGYDKGHIPGSHHVNTDDIEADTAVTPRGFWQLRPPAQLQALIERYGITKDSTVVVYSDPNMAAARVGWMLLYAGVKDVRLLNGGLRAWKAAGGEVELKRSPAPAPRAFGARVPVRPELRHGTEWVRTHLTDDRHVLADVRSWDEFIGKITGYAEVTGKGRIPGAKWAQGGANPHTLVSFYEDADGTLRAYTEVDAMWRKWGIDQRPSTFYCGTGWRASVAFFYALTMERPSPAVMDSGWMDWCMGPQAHINPVTQGAP